MEAIFIPPLAALPAAGKARLGSTVPRSVSSSYSATARSGSGYLRVASEWWTAIPRTTYHIHWRVSSPCGCLAPALSRQQLNMRHVSILAACGRAMSLR